MTRRRSHYLMLLLFASTALWAAAQQTPDELAERRATLQAIRKSQPEHYGRLRENADAFVHLPLERKGAIAALDLKMHELPPGRQARYWKTLERYADWLDQLKKSDKDAYQAIKDAPDAATRLALIKEQRDAEWMKTQPKTYRIEWKKRNGEERSQYVANLREKERKEHQHWVIAQRFWKELSDPKKSLPVRLNDFNTVQTKGDKTVVLPGKVNEYVSDYLMRYLTDEEKDQLKKAEGNWPDFPLTLVAIASKHPSALPPPRKEDFPSTPDKLPGPIVKTLEKKGSLKGKKIDVNVWRGQPFFGEKVVEVGTNKGTQPFDFEFWPSTLNGFQPPMKAFVKDQLIPKLDTREQAELDGVQGRWPYYPLKIQELAKSHNLDPPWHYLPEQNKWHWDRYRPARYQPPVAEQVKGKGETD